MFGVPSLVPGNVQEPIHTFNLRTVIFLRVVISHSINPSLLISWPLNTILKNWMGHLQVLILIVSTMQGRAGLPCY